MAELKLGLLPLYLQLYRDIAPAYDPIVAKFADTVANAIKAAGADIVQAPVCARADEVAPDVASFEEANVDAIVTLHLAYSPSLESIDALAATKLPVLMLDTTPDFAYPIDHSTLMANHGIHGVQDLANRLRRAGKPYKVFVGHWENSNVIQKLMESAMAAKCANAFMHSRVGRIGGDFKGMGDFVISDEAMARLGIETVKMDMNGYTVDEGRLKPVLDEIAAVKNMETENADSLVRASAIASLMVRDFIEKENLTAFTCSFLDACDSGVPTIPFVEACLAMSRGFGYAGEGDVLDAAWVGAILKVIKDTTFTEMFCPDWKTGRVYLSHMGEVNSALLQNPALRMQKGAYLKEPKPLAFTGSLKPGLATIVNLSPGPNDVPELITVRGEVMPFPENDNKRISGWFRPVTPFCDFLRKYSEFGGTHHSALCYGVHDSFWDDLACFLGIKHNVI